ncbi:filamentous hemagglutinin N-terminal domain-containing protein, partial [Hyella patelloides]|uniref:two-partner secretion domain-containing protein n=1 Tax=Hyella patelloides TaxID=1982969 RepID=UPI00119DC673
MKVISKTVFCLFPLLFPLSASAQITRDGTTSTTVTPTEAGVRIDDGNRAGGNLYHSFGEFSIPTGSEAFFNNASDIANIFSRVTGGNISNIDGLIRANGAANLFLINPAGIVFGEGASLQLGGSFYGSTADSIIFPDGEFSATDLENPPLITVNAPIGLGFRDNPGDIAINDDSTGQSFSFLAVNQGQNLALVGGNVSINRGFISAPGGRIELGGLASEGIITFDENGSLVFPEDVARGNVSLTQGTLIDVTSDGGGFIRVNANDLEIVDGSEIFAGIGEGLGTLESQAGDIEINARNISLFDGSQITSINSGLGNIGKITLNATENIVVDGGNSNSGVAQIVDPEATGDVGSINIQAQNLTLTDGGSIGNLVAGTADSGDINITVADTIVIDGFSELTTLPSQIISARANGDSGDISISTNNLFLSRSGVIINSILGQGNAGNINITAADSVTIDNTGIAENNEGSPRNGIFASVSASSIANGGDIEINTGNLFLTRGLISNSSAGDGDAGNITLNVANTFLADDSRINSNIGIGNREDAPALGKV